MIFSCCCTKFSLLCRLNERVLKAEKNNWLNLIGSLPTDTDYKKWSSQDTSTWLMDNLKYVYIPRKTVTNHLYTLWIAADLELPEGRKLMKEALDYLVIRRFCRINKTY